jgi:hypothetical protein
MLARLPDRKWRWYHTLPTGIIFGLGMQTHPEMITLVPVVIMVLILDFKHSVRWLRTSVPWLLLIGGAVGYGNMLAYNIMHRFKSVEFGLTYPEYALTREYTFTSITGNYIHEFLYLPRIILGLYDDAVSWSDYALHPMIWLFWILVILGFIITVREKRYLIPASFLSSFLIIPAINSNYTLNLGRYLVFMFPAALILLAEAVNYLMQRRKDQGIRGTWCHRTAFIIVVMLFIYPMLNIQTYYAYCRDNGLTRERYHRLDMMIQNSDLEHPLLVLDQETGEADDFHQYLREEGYTCFYTRFRNQRGVYRDIGEIGREISAVKMDQHHDGVILIVAPWNRYFVLKSIPVKKLLGQIDIRFEDKFVDFYRVYRL